MRTGAYPKPGLDQDASVPTLGHTLHTLMGTYGFDSPSFIPDLEPPKAYDLILQNVLLNCCSLLGLDVLLYMNQTLPIDPPFL